MIQLSIILPVYNVEQYICSCLESVFRQGLDEHIFEIIIVNDGTQDRSMEVIADIITKHSNIKVVIQKNHGLSVARNIGMENASGRYVLFIDSDDLLVDNTLPMMLSYAINMAADMVVGDYLKLSDEEIGGRNQSKMLPRKDQEIVFSGKGTDYYSHCYDQWAYAWRVLFKREFLVKNKIAFIPDIVWEDIPYMVECLLNAEKLIKVSLPFYIYRQHRGSIGNALNTKNIIDTNRVMEILWKMKNDPLITTEVQNNLADTLYTTFKHYKWRILLNDNIYSERREIIRDLINRIPDLRFSHGYKQVATTMLFRLMPYRYFEIRKYINDTIWLFKNKWKK